MSLLYRMVLVVSKLEGRSLRSHPCVKYSQPSGSASPGGLLCIARRDSWALLGTLKREGYG
jgi:hypothetical protein